MIRSVAIAFIAVTSIGAASSQTISLSGGKVVCDSVGDSVDSAAKHIQMTDEYVRRELKKREKQGAVKSAGPLLRTGGYCAVRLDPNHDLSPVGTTSYPLGNAGYECFSADAVGNARLYVGVSVCGIEVE